MVGRLLLCGMLIGAVAGLLAFGAARLLGEPQIGRAVAFEEQQARARGSDASEPELVSRSTQAGIGLFTGIVVYGSALGGLFGLAFAAVYGRLGNGGNFGPRPTAGLLALAGFVAIVLVPALKYPANPPAVGDPATIGDRTSLHFFMLAVSVAALTLAIILRRRLMPRFGGRTAALLALLAFIAAIAVAQYLLPDVNEVPPQFPADTLWRFRLASLATQAVLWATLGLLFGAAAERSMRRA